MNVHGGGGVISVGERRGEVSDTVMVAVGKCAIYGIAKWLQRRKDLLYGELMDGSWSPPSSMNSWTQHM